MVNDHIKSISEEAESKEGKQEGVKMSPRRVSKLKRRPQMQHINYVLSRQVFRDLETKDPKELMALGKRTTAEERQLGRYVVFICLSARTNMVQCEWSSVQRLCQGRQCLVVRHAVDLLH